MAWPGWESFAPPKAPAKRMARAKYGAVQTTVDGITFASKREADRYGELKLLQKAGQIRNLTLQQPYPLKVTFWRNGGSKDIVIGKYIADFAYVDVAQNHEVIEDVKGVRTPLYRWKKKHVEAQYGVTILET